MLWTRFFRLHQQARLEAAMKVGVEVRRSSAAGCVMGSRACE